MPDIDRLQRQDQIERNADDINSGKDHSENVAKAFQIATALRMQERRESYEEISKYIYEYKGRAMNAGPALLCPGDYMILNSSGSNLCSCRGADISLAAGDLEKLLESGALDETFDTDDPASPDFTRKLEGILDRMAMQAEYRDGHKYCMNSNGLSIGVFAEDALTKAPTAVIVKSASGFACAAGNEISDSIADMAKHAVDGNSSPIRECSYDEFNPGGRNIKKELSDSINPERENIDNKMADMREAVSDNANSRPSAKQKPSPFDALKTAAERQPEDDGLGQAEDNISPLANSKAMRRMGID